MAKSTFKIAKSSGKSMSKEDMNALIAKKSYELYEKRGRRTGHAMQDWLEAEKIIKAKLGI